MINILKPLIKQFMPFAQERMGFDHPPRLFLRQDTTNADNPLGKTAYYDFQAKSVTLYITGRHPKDIMRSLAHELVHHKQNCDGQFENIGEMGEGYAQTNPHLRQMEIAANRDGNMCFRDWEDSIKGTIYNEHLLKGVNNTMSTKTWKNKELTTLLSEAWGFGFDLDNLNEKADKNTGMSGVKGDDQDDTSCGHFKPKKEGIEEEDLDESDVLDEGKYLGKAMGTAGGAIGGAVGAALPIPGAMRAGAKLGHKMGKATGQAAGLGMTPEQEKEERDKKKEEEREIASAQSDLNKQKRDLAEDSGEAEAWHEWKNEHADDDHIREIEHHLRALKDDRDYERHGAEYDHDKYEDEGDSDLEERKGRGRDREGMAPDSRRRPGPMEEQAVRKLVRRTIRKIYHENKKK